MNDDLAKQLLQLMAIQADIERSTKLMSLQAEPMPAPEKPKRLYLVAEFMLEHAAPIFAAVVICSLLSVATIGTMQVCRISDEACSAALAAAAVGAVIGVFAGLVGSAIR